MELLLLRTYQEQVVYSCRAVLLALEDIQTGLKALEDIQTGLDAEHDTNEEARLWYGVQNFIIGAGNVSKALWGAGGSRYAERQPLRDSLQADDSSPLKNIKIRNDYEHLDERIEKWWKKDKSHNRVGIYIGPRGGVVGLHETSMMRWIDPTTGDVIFWGNELNIPEVAQEVQRILPIANAENSKPHWET